MLGGAAMSEYLLEMKNITKIFPGVKALDSVQFNLRAGEIHALVGENGAGKSTFIKTLTGVHQPDGGEIILEGQKVVMSDPIVAQKYGIAAIYQHAASYPDLSVAENIFIGHEFMMMNEEIKTLPFGDVWEHYCETQGVPGGREWYDVVAQYEKDVLSKRA